MGVAVLVLLAAATVGVLLIFTSSDLVSRVSRAALTQVDVERLRTGVLGAGREAQQQILGGRSPDHAVTALREESLRDWTLLRGRLQSDLGQVQRLDALRPLIEGRFDLLLALTRRNDGYFNPATIDPQAPERMVQIKRIEALLDEVSAAIGQSRLARERSLANTAIASAGLVVGMALLVLSLQTAGARAVKAEVMRSASAEAAARDAAAALQRLNAQLETRVAERTAALEERNQAMGEMHSRLATVSRELLRTAEAERRALARELHDDLGQQMAALKMNLQLIRRYADDRHERLDDSVQVVDDCIAQLRERAMNLRPAMLDELGLPDALRAHAHRQSQRTGLAIALHLDGDGALVDAHDDWLSAVYRIVQEALRNVERHAGATRVDITLRRDGDAVLLSIRDDGGGLAAGAPARDSSGERMGLLTMRERTELLRGEFGVHAVVPHGVEVRCRWPLREVFDGPARVAWHDDAAAGRGHAASADAPHAL